MARNTPREPVRPQPPLGSTVFYVRKGAIWPLLQGLAQMQGRPDLSGKFARKLGRIRRAVHPIHEAVQEERKSLVMSLAKRYPEGHAKAGELIPVYQIGPDSLPIFRKDPETGEPTTEKEVVLGEYHEKEYGAFGRAWAVEMAKVVTFECPALTVEDLDQFEKIGGQIVDALLEVEEDGPTTRAPSEGVVLRLVEVPIDQLAGESSPLRIVRDEVRSEEEVSKDLEGVKDVDAVDVKTENYEREHEAPALAE